MKTFCMKCGNASTWDKEVNMYRLIGPNEDVLYWAATLCQPCSDELGDTLRSLTRTPAEKTEEPS